MQFLCRSMDERYWTYMSWYKKIAEVTSCMASWSIWSILINCRRYRCIYDVVLMALCIHPDKLKAHRTCASTSGSSPLPWDPRCPFLHVIQILLDPTGPSLRGRLFAPCILYLACIYLFVLPPCILGNELFPPQLFSSVMGDFLFLRLRRVCSGFNAYSSGALRSV
jgi:hypothetical protein